MSLADYVPERHEIKLSGDNSCFVQGLSLESLAILIQTHLPDMESMSKLFTVGGDLGNEGMELIIVAIMSQAPGLASNIIALAAGETNAVEAASRIPGPQQFDILMKIGALTFTEVGGVKKFVETVTRLLAKTNMNEKIKQALTTTKTVS